jgi:hypothetical protein
MPSIPNLNSKDVVAWTGSTLAVAAGLAFDFHDAKDFRVIGSAASSFPTPS